MEQRTSRRISKRERRKRRLKRMVIRLVCRCLMLCLLVSVLIWGVKCYQRIQLTDGKQMAQEGYPESLVALWERNPETEDFVLGYFENKDKHQEIDLADEVEQGTIPLFLQWDMRWGYETYGSDFLAVTGCGPTCLSMVVCGLSGDTRWNPLKVAEMAEEEGYYVSGVGSSWELMTKGAAKLGLYAEEGRYEADYIVEQLNNGTPIICIMRAGDFTTSGHFIVLTGVDDDGGISVCDPNSRKNSEKTWDVSTLMPQIKNLWTYQYDNY